MNTHWGFILMRWDFGTEEAPNLTATEVRIRQEYDERRRRHAIRTAEDRMDRAFRDMALYGQGFFRSQPSGRSPEAEARGLKLLEENLNPTQLVQWKKGKKFLAIGGQSGDKYEIREGYNQNVFRIDKQYRRKGLCFLPAGNLCIGDTLLAQKIGIELHEEEILRVAIPF